MTYDHSRKAGNLGDVWKHNVLVALVDAMPGNIESFRYVECHAGAPIHNLTDGGEWVRGVKVVKHALRDSCYMAMANEWLDLGQYPASWMFVADRLARRFAHVEMTLFDDADYVAAQYPPPAAGIPTNVRLAFRQADGYAAAAKLDRADLVFLDPPYHPNAVKDWERLGRTCRALARTIRGDRDSAPGRRRRNRTRSRTTGNDQWAAIGTFSTARGRWLSAEWT